MAQFWHGDRFDGVLASDERPWAPLGEMVRQALDTHTPRWPVGPSMLGAVAPGVDSMASVGWGQGIPEEPDTKIAQTLISYAMRGGALFGARRWVENPLTLTHTLWQSPDGDT